MSKQIKGIDIEIFKKVTDVIYELCPYEFGMVACVECSRQHIECLDCWIKALSKENNGGTN